METVKVYQLGIGSFGRYGFEKFVELTNYFDEADVQLEGVCDTDPEKVEEAQKFAEANGLEIKKFREAEEMYQEAAKEDSQVLIYDAGPAETHAENIYRSLRHGFFHLAEKPPSMSRDEHLKEKRLAENSDVMWMVDFIERESPVVRKALELIEGKEIEGIKVFRESSAGVEKILEPVERAGVKGGDILDKMVHEVYVLDFLEAARDSDYTDFELADTEINYFLPKGLDSEKLLGIRGGYTEEISLETATGQTKAVFNSGGTSIELNSSWLGLSENAKIEAKKIREKTGYNVLKEDFSELNNKAYSNEEARFFVIEGEEQLAGDMLQKKLFDLETGEEVELDYYMHDQLYRVIEKAVLTAVGEDSYDRLEEETEIFMHSIFDVKEADLEKDFLEELEKGSKKVKNMIVFDKSILERETEQIAG